MPALGWAHISGDQGGVAVLDRGRPGHCFQENALRVSLVRCATGDHDPRTDQGRISSKLRVVFHEGDFAGADMPGRSQDFSFPPLAWQVESEYARGAYIPALCRVSEPGIVLSAVKISEDRKALVLSFYESLGRNRDVHFSWNDKLEISEIFASDIMESAVERIPGFGPASFNPFKIKTIRLTLKKKVSDFRTLTGPGFSNHQRDRQEPKD